MQRRDFVKLGLLFGASSLAHSSDATATSDTTKAENVNNHSPILEADVTALQAQMNAGTLSARALTEFYLNRISHIDKSGAAINAVIELNPDALAIADALDSERKTKGARGALHGIPVLIKDNIATADKMQTTAGSLALVGAKAPRDAFVAQRLRAAGAIILGKTNLSEWANIRSTRSTSGWSARGGLTKNPYALDRNCSGSSSGSAAAVAANLAAITVGTETDGSIVSPASLCSAVGMKPSLGLVSRDGIVPIAHSQDTAGPMTRNVTDAALLLTALVGVDERDQITLAHKNPAINYATFLKKDGLQGARIGVVTNAMSSNMRQQAVIDQALQVLKQQGAILIEVELPNMTAYAESELEVLMFELKADLNRYLQEFGQGAKVKTLADVIAFNEANRQTEMPYFDQELLIKAQAKGDLTDPAYVAALANNQRYSRTEGIDKIMQQHQLDALVGSTGGLAWINDYVNGDHIIDGFSTPAAVAGYPHITVPAGFVSELPVGLSFVGLQFSDAKLIQYAYAYEQASLQRRAPKFIKNSM